jgi:DNA-binding transcriptional regulator YdaS (Cro superfamily)
MKKSKDKMEPGLKLAIEAVGTKYRLAQLLRIKPQSVQHWRRVPKKRVQKIARITGLDRAQLRPDLFGEE